MRLFVPLTRDEFDRLRDLARVERRRPQEQAAVLLTRALDTPATIPPLLGEAPGGGMRVGDRDSHCALVEVLS